MANVLKQKEVRRCIGSDSILVFTDAPYSMGIAIVTRLSTDHDIEYHNTYISQTRVLVLLSPVAAVLS